MVYVGCQVAKKKNKLGKINVFVHNFSFGGRKCLQKLRITTQICITTNKMYEILCNKTLFSLDVLQVSDYISPCSGATS
jgi:hypothetical protein